jgi:hypothetical protein
LPKFPKHPNYFCAPHIIYAVQYIMKYITYGQTVWYAILIALIVSLIAHFTGFQSMIMFGIAGLVQLGIIIWWLYSWYKFEDSMCNNMYFSLKDLTGSTLPPESQSTAHRIKKSYFGHQSRYANKLIRITQNQRRFQLSWTKRKKNETHISTIQHGSNYIQSAPSYAS